VVCVACLVSRPLMADKKRVTVCLNGDQENQKCMLVPNDWGLFVVNIRTKFSLKESHVKVSHFRPLFISPDALHTR
jgi:hypothetical protein